MPDHAALQRLRDHVNRQAASLGGTFDVVVDEETGQSRRRKPRPRIAEVLEIADHVLHGEDPEILREALGVLHVRVLEGIQRLLAEGELFPDDDIVPRTIAANEEVLQSLERMAQYCDDGREEQLRAGMAALEAAMRDIEELVAASRDAEAAAVKAYEATDASELTDAGEVSDLSHVPEPPSQ